MPRLSLPASLAPPPSPVADSALQVRPVPDDPVALSAGDVVVAGLEGQVVPRPPVPAALAPPPAPVANSAVPVRPVAEEIRMWRTLTWLSLGGWDSCFRLRLHLCSSRRGQRPPLKARGRRDPPRTSRNLWRLADPWSTCAEVDTSTGPSAGGGLRHAICLPSSFPERTLFLCFVSRPPRRLPRAAFSSAPAQVQQQVRLRGVMTMNYHGSLLWRVLWCRTWCHLRCCPRRSWCLYRRRRRLMGPRRRLLQPLLRLPPPR